MSTAPVLNETVACVQASCRRGPTGKAKVVAWAAQLVAAAILGQTLFFKFTYAPETQVIFGDRGGRPAAIAAGVVELLCVVLLLLSRTAGVGALLSLGVMAGALFTHLTVLGIAVVDPATGTSDGGFLFALAFIVTAAALVVLYLRRGQLPFVGKWLSAF